MASLYTIVLNRNEALDLGHEVYATFRDDYEHDDGRAGRSWGFWMWGLDVRESMVQRGFSSALEAEAGAHLAYENWKNPAPPAPSKPIASFGLLKGGVKPNRIFGQVLALMREYHLLEPVSFVRRTSFFAGDGTSDYPKTGGIGVTWWQTQHGEELLEGIVDMAIASDSTLRGGDRTSFCEAIENMLEGNALNPDLFYRDHFLERDVKTLFDARALSDVNEFANRLWEKMHGAMSNAMTTWLVVYPLARIKSPSVRLSYDGLSLVAPNEPALWRELTANYRNAARWDPSKGAPADFVLPRGAFDQELSSWIVCEVKGTQKGSQRLAARRIRTFLAVLFAHLYPSEKALLTRSEAAELTHSKQFAIDGSRCTWPQVISFLGLLLPSLIVDIELTPTLLAEVAAWYETQECAGEDVRERSLAATQFIGYGIVADDLERFIHFFIGLDALFGERGNVEAGIVNGIKQTFVGDNSWDYRTPRLFDLRSSLVHGGTISIDEWKGLDRYRFHIKSHPSLDVTTAVMTALCQYPNNLPESRKSRRRVRVPLRILLSAFLLGFFGGVFVGKKR